jgi:hypothetical protein
MSRRPLCNEPPKIEGYSKASFFIMLITTIILAVILVVILIIYFQRGATLVDPSKCPVKVSGILISPNTKVTTVATNCGNVANCTFAVGSVQDAVDICKNLGPTKCSTFSMQQQSNSNNYTMVVSSSTNISSQNDSDSYLFVN